MTATQDQKESGAGLGFKGAANLANAPAALTCHIGKRTTACPACTVIELAALVFAAGPNARGTRKLWGATRESRRAPARCGPNALLDVPVELSHEAPSPTSLSRLSSPPPTVFVDLEELHPFPLQNCTSFCLESTLLIGPELHAMKLIRNLIGWLSFIPASHPTQHSPSALPASEGSAKLARSPLPASEGSAKLARSPLPGTLPP